MHVVGVTSNPTIFAKALSKGSAYDDQVGRPGRRAGSSLDEAARAITTYDIRWACDVLRPGLRRHRRPGRPGLDRGRPAAGAGTPARPSPRPGRCGGCVDRPNMFIKIPATEEGLPAITADPGRGHQRQRHADLLAGALRRGHRRVHGGPGGARRPATTCRRIASVASFFVSRVDTEVDERLDKIGTPEAQALRGKAAHRQRPAGLRAVRAEVRHRPLGRRWPPRGARPQRPLWASTSAKDPDVQATPCT